MASRAQISPGAERAGISGGGVSLWRSTVRRGAFRSAGMAAGAGVTLGVLLLVLALASYRTSDPALNTDAGGAPANLAGLPGAWVADLLLTALGPAAALLLPVLLVLGRRLWRGAPADRWRAMLRDTVIGTALMAGALAVVSDAAVMALPAGWGGVVGLALSGVAGWATGLIPDPVIGTWALRATGVVLGLAGAVVWARALEIDWAEVARRRAERRPRSVHERVPYDEDDEPLELTRRPLAPRPEPEVEAAREVADRATERTGPVVADRPAAPAPIRGKAKAGARAEGPGADGPRAGSSYHLPGLELLAPVPPAPKGAIDRAGLERSARLLETVLDDFKVQGTIGEVRPGPVVTMYELEPAPGIKASRVVALSDDIARNMSAVSARVAVIPGRNVIGIELPNPKREGVSFRELASAPVFEDQTASLPIILGKNIAGDPVVADLAPMPHLLVAGTTGSGKSVGLNGMILSLLYRLTPDECRMIMIDPKMLELSAYDDIPHLLSPVVTDPAKAVRALKWAVETMEDRYRQMSSLGVRSLASFNDKVRAAQTKGQPLGRRVQTGYDPESGAPIYEEEQLDYQVLPKIVVIVDELADLMMTAGKEVEFLIQRLAQKARAAGIHLIMATQRPSVDVITGVIKANLPTRISFHVTSKIDSRTILGEQGAEQLLGKGDMLYMPGGKGIVRVHGPFVSDDEVHAVAEHWRGQGAPDYVSSVTEEPAESFALDGAPDGEDSPEDQQFRQAVQLVCESGKASTSWLQRQLRIGYNSAARLIERMEKEGVVGRPDHVGRREVLKDAEGHAI